MGWSEDKKNRRCGQVISIPKDKLDSVKQYFPDEKICVGEEEHVNFRYKSKCNGDDGIEMSSLSSQLENCVAVRKALQTQNNNLNLKLTELENEISSYVPVSTVESIMKDKFCAPYNVLNTKFEKVKEELKECQNAYNDRTTQLNGVYAKYKDDVIKYHEKIKELIGNGDTSVISEEKQQIYKEESLMLQGKIRKNWRKLYIVLVILVVVIILCILKFFEFI
tara:strand:- start:227 stop:892 length:666 start_codon:yes stop_codon:yes gene_type:complete